MDKLRDLGFALMLFTIGITQTIAADGDYTEFDKMVSLTVLIVSLMMIVLSRLREE